jgi:plastocyanin
MYLPAVHRTAICLLACAVPVLTATGAAGANVDVQGRAARGGHPLKYAVVWLEAPNAPPLRQPATAKMDQKDLTFKPHVLAIRTGTTVAFPNNDKVMHAVYSWKEGKRFDIPLYAAGKTEKRVFDKPGLSKLFCDIHPHMAAYIMTVDSPYFAVSDEKGSLTLKDVPEGRYTYRAWRPGGKTLTGTVDVRSGQTFEVSWP